VQCHKVTRAFFLRYRGSGLVYYKFIYNYILIYNYIFISTGIQGYRCNVGVQVYRSSARIHGYMNSTEVEWVQ